MEALADSHVPPIRIVWDRVEALMAEAGITSTAELARRAEVSQSTFTRARRGAASGSAIAALRRVFPDASLDDLIEVPKAA